MDQNDAPVLEALAEHQNLERYGFTPPAHRQGRGVDPRVLDVLGEQSFKSDVVASSGLDDRQSSNGYLQDAESLLAEAVGADMAFFSTCGSSLSIKAAILAVTRGEGELLISRDAHKSVVSGLVLSGLQPRWIRPKWDNELKLSHPPSPETVEEMWQRYPDASAALIVSPTPYGTCADIEAIAKVCHKRGKPLIVDEAWGAQLPFHDDTPTWAMSAGADICVVSVHKMGLGFEQGSIFHLQGDLVDPVRLSQCADILSTTSASTLIYAAMDGWRRQMVQHGKAMIDKTLKLTRQLRRDIDAIPGLHVLEEELVHAEASHDLDIQHIMIDVSKLGISGFQATDWLRENCRVDMGTTDHRRTEAVISVTDDEETADLLLTSLRALAEAAPEMPRPPEVIIPDEKDLFLETVMLPRDAFFGPVEVVPVEEASGRIAAEMATPYPPGVPLLLPGERINKAALDYLRSGVEAGMVLPDPADATLKTVRVVREEL
ncbi:arginine/lysine/ornithine decarboxylase [Okibacterium sp. HSC-33S16]|uniref:aminotransferase class I/II-fold pyridoxal phosphate-dependent enzyme n=1 Tax=Okibacterium sp. HSC-33S16 TaxID=2910965 RepID=UPI00273A7202|nr:ornithine decarboxylase [Okibacterium sp. HSC-33S16]MCP2031324.1 arginine/lysine/ornithine decarboxylase [Okibacterium sp. HSC-33S16]